MNTLIAIGLSSVAAGTFYKGEIVVQLFRTVKGSLSLVTASSHRSKIRYRSNNCYRSRFVVGSRSGPGIGNWNGI
jgi:hypothetical protein